MTKARMRAHGVAWAISGVFAGSVVAAWLLPHALGWLAIGGYFPLVWLVIKYDAAKEAMRLEQSAEAQWAKYLTEAHGELAAFGIEEPLPPVNVIDGKKFPDPGSKKWSCQSGEYWFYPVGDGHFMLHDDYIKAGGVEVAKGEHVRAYSRAVWSAQHRRALDAIPDAGGDR